MTDARKWPSKPLRRSPKHSIYAGGGFSSPTQVSPPLALLRNRNMNNIIFIICVVLLTIAIGTFVITVLIDDVRSNSYNKGYAYIKSIKELQEQVGAEPDGIWGKETDRLYDDAYCNQCAIKSMERMSK